jgi:hypothetical protein
VLGRIRSQQDFAAGLLFIVIAVATLWIGWGYPIGTAVRMNAGYFPRMLGGILLLLGLITLLGSLTADGPKITPVRMRPVVMIPLAVIAFGFACAHFGFVLASIFVTIFGSFASPETRFKEMVVASLLLTLSAVAIFIWGVGLPIPLWPEF